MSAPLSRQGRGDSDSATAPCMELLLLSNSGIETTDVMFE